MSDMLDFRPLRKPIAVLAGDSLSITCTVTGIENLTNPVFTGQVRDGGTVVEDFVVTPDATGAVLRLTPAQTRSMFEAGSLQQVVGAAAGGAWRGDYDIQLAHDPDVVRTFMRGTFTVESDVTRDD